MDEDDEEEDAEDQDVTVATGIVKSRSSKDLIRTDPTAATAADAGGTATTGIQEQEGEEEEEEGDEQVPASDAGVGAAASSGEAVAAAAGGVANGSSGEHEGGAAAGGAGAGAGEDEVSCPAVVDVILHPVGAIDGPATLRRLVLVLLLDDGDLLVYEARMSTVAAGDAGREQVSGVESWPRVGCYWGIGGWGWG